MRTMYIFLLVLFFQIAYAQNQIINSPTAISSCGNTWTIDNYNLCFTVGELAIETFSQNSIILTQGFHQEQEYSIINISESTQGPMISVFPNPTQDKLDIIFNNHHDYANLSLKDMRGNTIINYSNISTNEKTSMELSQFSQGVYFIEILLKNSQQKIVYQIQKIN